MMQVSFTFSLYTYITKAQGKKELPWTYDKQAGPITKVGIFGSLSTIKNNMGIYIKQPMFLFSFTKFDRRRLYLYLEEVVTA